MEMSKSVRKYYLISLGILLALSAYPLVMGVKIIVLQIMQGGIRPTDYARYVIPYTAVCVSVLVSAAVYPLFRKLGKIALPAATALALCLFAAIELLIESIVRPALMLQLLSCVYTPTAVYAFQGLYGDSYKIHYFLVSFLLVTLVTGVFYGYAKLLSGRERAKKVPLILQSAVTVLLLGLCIFANFTGFFREKTDYLTPLSSMLTGLYFVVLGTAAGIYTGSLLIGRGRLLSVWLPAVVSVLVCIVMYFGEYSMFQGTLYRFGQGWFYEGIPNLALAPADILVVFFTGAAAACAMAVARSVWRRQGTK
jgi:hypothetical protein